MEENKTTNTATENLENDNNLNAEIQNDTTTQAEDKKDQTKQPSVDELVAKLAAAEAEKLKLKNANDKLSREAADSKRALRAKQTAEERESEEKAEAERQRQEELDNVKNELNHIKAVSAYKTFSDEKTIEQMIEAVSEQDHAAIAAILDLEVDKRVKAAKAEWMKSRPQVNSGNGSSMTKEQILAIKDPSERQRAIAANIDLFNS